MWSRRRSRPIHDAAELGAAPINLKAMAQQRNSLQQRAAGQGAALGQAAPNGTPPTPTLQPNSTMMQAQAAPPMIAPAAGQ